MKEVKAYVRKDRLDAVVNSLANIEGLSGTSVNRITGFGRSRGRLRLVDFETHFKVETVCTDNLMDKVVTAILQAAHSGQRGDGKIFVSEINQAFRIQTGDQLDERP